MSTNTSELEKANNPRDLGSPLKLLFNTLALFLVSQFIATVVVLVGLSLLHSGSEPTDLLNHSNAAQFLLILIAESLAVFITLKLVKRRKLPLDFIGLGRRPVWLDLWRALFGFLIFWALLIVVGILLAWLAPGLNTNQEQDLGFTELTSRPDTILALLALVILPPLGEETLIRGYLYSGLRSRWSFPAAMLATSLLFGIAHLELGSGNPLVWAAALNTFILSIVLVYLRERSGALYASILVHMLNNLVAFGVHFHS